MQAKLLSSNIATNVSMILIYFQILYFWRSRTAVLLLVLAKDDGHNLTNPVAREIKEPHLQHVTWTKILAH